MEIRQPAKPARNEVLRLIARLGGFISRKSDGEPGLKTIWLGLKEGVLKDQVQHLLL